MAIGKLADNRAVITAALEATTEGFTGSRETSRTPGAQNVII